MMKLLVFPHSHYCEKARWALDHKSVSYQPVAIMPGFHMITVRRYAPGTSVPVLLDDSTVIQGSGEIIDYLDQKITGCPLTPTDKQERKLCMEIERETGEGIGEGLRQILYSRLLLYPDFIRYCFTHPLSWMHRQVFTLLYPVLRSKMHQGYVISPQSVEKARRDFHDGMDKLAGIIGDKQYMVGGQFSRADLSVASMLSLLVMPPEHPFPWKEIPDDEIRSFLDEYRLHPVSLWVKDIYRRHR